MLAGNCIIHWSQRPNTGGLQTGKFMAWQIQPAMSAPGRLCRTGLQTPSGSLSLMHMDSTPLCLPKPVVPDGFATPSGSLSLMHMDSTPLCLPQAGSDIDSEDLQKQ